MPDPIPFPPICPKGNRTLSFGRFPTKTSQFLSGATQTREFARKSRELIFSVDLGVITDAEVIAIQNTWEAAKGPCYRVLISNVLFEGMDVTIINTVPTDYITWRMRSAPVINSVAPGYSRVSVEFVGDPVYLP